MTLSLCLVPLYSRSLPAPAPALPVRHRGAASRARAPKKVPRIQMTPQLGEPSSMQADTRFSIIPRTDDANARGEVLCRYSCTRRAKGPRSAARASSPPDGSRAARVDPAPSRAPHAGSNHAARARRRRSTKSPRASRPRCTRRPRLPGMREAINCTQRQSVALGGMGIYGHQKLSAAISGHQRN
jgi:hypothetical protein